VDLFTDAGRNGDWVGVFQRLFRTANVTKISVLFFSGKLSHRLRMLRAVWVGCISKYILLAIPSSRVFICEALK